MIITTEFHASVFFLPFDNLRVEFVFHSVKDNCSIAVIFSFCLGNDITDVWLNKSKAVVKPGFNEVFEFFFDKFGVFNDILFNYQVLICLVTHVNDAD